MTTRILTPYGVFPSPRILDDTPRALPTSFRHELTWDNPLAASPRAETIPCCMCGRQGRYSLRDRLVPGVCEACTHVHYYPGPGSERHWLHPLQPRALWREVGGPVDLDPEPPIVPAAPQSSLGPEPYPGWVPDARCGCEWCAPCFPAEPAVPAAPRAPSSRRRECLGMRELQDIDASNVSCSSHRPGTTLKYH